MKRFCARRFNQDREFVETARLLRRGLRGLLQIAPQRHQIQMYADQSFRERTGEARHDERSPISPLRAEAPVAEHVRHRFGKDDGNVFDRKSFLTPCK